VLKCIDAKAYQIYKVGLPDGKGRLRARRKYELTDRDGSLTSAGDIVGAPIGDTRDVLQRVGWTRSRTSAKSALVKSGRMTGFRAGNRSLFGRSGRSQASNTRCKRSLERRLLIGPLTAKVGRTNNQQGMP